MIYTIRAMKRFTFLIFGSLFCFGWTFSDAEAALFINEGCEDVDVLEEVLDSHTESRFARYLQTSGEPRTFTSEEQYQRWCFLWNENETLKTTRRSTRADIRMRSLDVRFYKVRQEREEIDFSTDLTFEDLSPSRQGRVLGRVKSDNCDPGSGSERDLVEYTICKQLVEEKDTMRQNSYQSRRLDIRAIRSTPARIKRAVEDRLARRLQDYTGGSAGATEIRSIDQSVDEGMEDFDPEGEGSVPLDESIENRIKRYVDRGDCLRLRNDVEKQRCEWFIQYNRHRRKAQQAQVLNRLRSKGVGDDVRIRRGVQQTYRGMIGTTRGVIQSRRLQGGFRPTPRTIHEAQENFQTPVVAPGECEIDPLHCN